MRCLLDTDLCIRLLNRRPGFEKVLRRISGRSYGEILISAITVSELCYGIANSAKQKDNAAALEAFLALFEVCDYPVVAADHYGAIRAELERAGQPIGGNDLLIAAHARALGASIATANVREFRRVPGLLILDWTD